MTQSPENMGGQPEPHPPADPSPGDQDVSPSPASAAPPPDTWHFPAEPVPAVAEATVAPPNGAQAPYGTSPHYGTPSPPGAGQPRGYATPYGSANRAYRGGPPGPDPTLAEWWRRLLARLIDVVVVGIVLLPVTIPLLSGPFGRLEQVTNQYPDISAPGAESALSRADSKFLVALWLVAIIAAVVWFLYDSLQHAKWGQTLGKRVLSTRVVSAYDRSPIGTGMAFRRAAVYALVPVIPVVGTFFAVLNELWLLWDRRRQCLHDKAAHTIVIRTDVPASNQWQGSPW